MGKKNNQNESGYAHLDVQQISRQVLGELVDLDPNNSYAGVDSSFADSSRSTLREIGVGVRNARLSLASFTITDRVQITRYSAIGNGVGIDGATGLHAHRSLKITDNTAVIGKSFEARMAGIKINGGVQRMETSYRMSQRSVLGGSLTAVQKAEDVLNGLRGTHNVAIKTLDSEINF